MKELLALKRYLGEFDNTQVAFEVRQREPKTINKAVTAILEIESYLHPRVRQEVNVSGVAEEAGTQSIAVMLTTGSVQDKVVEMLKTLTARLEKLEISIEHVAGQWGQLVLVVMVVVIYSKLYAMDVGKLFISQETVLLRETIKAGKLEPLTTRD